VTARFVDAGGDPGAPSSGTAPRRWRDLAILLPVFGALLLLPPIVALTAPAGLVWGIPAIVIYLFGVWAVLIALAARVAVGLGRAAPGGARPSPDPEPPA